MADDKPTEVYYRLARSAVRIKGDVTKDFDPKTSKPRQSSTTDVELHVEADPRIGWRCRLPMGSRFMKDKQFQLAFTGDGRLTSSSATVSGAGAAVIEAGIRVGTFVASTLIGGRGFLEGDIVREPPDDAKTFDEVLEEENGDLYRRREAYRAALTALQDKLAAHGKRVAESRDTPTPALPAEGRILQGTLARVRAEAEQVEDEVDAWRGKRFPSSSKQHTFSVGTDALPQLESATPTASFVIEDLAPALRDAAKTLGVVVVRVADVEEDALNFTTEDLEDESGIWFRTARPTNLAVYERELEADKADEGEKEGKTFTLRKVMPAWVVDSDSRLGFLRFDSGIFDKQTGALGFGDTGALTTLASTDESPARQLSAAFGAAPGQIKESMEQAVAVTASLSKLRAAGAEQELADVERRRKLLEAEIAEKGVLSTRSQREELDRLKIRAEIAEAEKKLQPAPTPPVSANLELEKELARAKLELELMQAQVELGWLKRDASNGS